MKKKLFIFSTVITVLLFGVYGCIKKPDVSGIYKGNIEITDQGPNKYSGSGWVPNISKQTLTIELMLAQTDKNISGKIAFGGQSLTIVSGIILDKTISIKTDNFQIDAIVNGNSIDGNINGQYMGQDSGGHTVTGSFKTIK